MTTLSLSELVQEGEPTFSDWLDEQEFEYRRAESEDIDYVNDVLDYSPVDSSSKKVKKIEGWEELFESCKIEQDSKRGKAIKQHIKAYVANRSP